LRCTGRSPPRLARGKAADRLGDRLHPSPKFRAMAGDADHALAGEAPLELGEARGELGLGRCAR
jgi:hypothetical protein